MASSPYPIRTISPDEFDTWYDVTTAAFHGSTSAELTQARRDITEIDRALAAVDPQSAGGEEIVATAAALSLQMRVPGGSQRVAGVTEVAVAPTHRRRGILRSLMTRQFADFHERGEAVAALFASESSIYGRFGYGCASHDVSLRLHRGEGRFVPRAPATDGLAIRALPPQQARSQLAQIFADQQPVRPGMFARDEAWWTRTVLDPEQHRNGAGAMQCVLVEDQERPRGYALFHIRESWDDDFLPSHDLRVREVAATDSAAYAAVWRHLLDRDLVGTVTATRPSDDPLLSLLADPRRARAQRRDGLWVRVIDVGAALSGRAYTRPVDLVLDVTDDLCPWNAGRWRLAGDEHGAKCERTADTADVTISATDLGAGYLGGGDLGSAVTAGLVEERRPGAAHTLATAMRWEPQPWCPTGF